MFWSEPDGGWIADVPDLQSCSAFGDTPAEALAEIEQAIEAWLAVAREDGPPIPEPCYRAPTRAAGVESVQAIRSCLVPTLTDIAGLEAMSQTVKGFGWRPVVSYPPVLRAGVRKPPRKEPAGAGRTASGLWGFDGAVAWVGDALAGVIGGGLTIAVVSLAPRWPLTGRFWPERRPRACGWRRWGDSDATPEAGFPGRRKVQ